MADGDDLIGASVAGVHDLLNSQQLLTTIHSHGISSRPIEGDEDLYNLICERYERRSILLTSNRAPEEWAGVFGNPLMASAALDRLTHHSHLLILEGESYRQRDRKTKKT
ncbi:MAG: ATP-binding protein [Sumerlaeia bacterium]